MEKTARAIITIGDDYLFMKREKIRDNKNCLFYTTIGGHLEPGESYEEACMREVYEELGIKVKIESLFYEQFTEDLGRYEKFYNIKYISGILGTGKGEEFTRENIKKYGKYSIERINKNELYKYNILPIEIKNKIIEKINN